MMMHSLWLLWHLLQCDDFQWRPSMAWRRTALTFLLLANMALAQGRPGAIAGKVTDPDGQAVPGASVQARDTATGAVFKTESSRAGIFTLSQLPAGNYN